ncbi:MAG: hypothetical protein AAF385_03860 [Pseudomonadota bacterium]
MIVACGQQPKTEPVAQSRVQNQDLREYRELRKIQGHFAGGDWNDAVDKFDGRKHRLMKSLGIAAEQESWSAAELRARLGSPDLEPGTDGTLQQLLDSALSGDDTGAAIAAYFWRGNHDVLIFYQNSNGALAHAWWYAGE